MSKFNITKKISLTPVLGEGHEADVLAFKPMTFKDARELEGLQSTEDFTPEIPQGADKATIKRLTDEAQARENKAALDAVDKAIEFIKAKFVSGKITDETTGKQVEVEADDFTNGNIGVEVINYCMKQLAGANKPEDFTKA